MICGYQYFSKPPQSIYNYGTHHHSTYGYGSICHQKNGWFNTQTGWFGGSIIAPFIYPYDIYEIPPCSFLGQFLICPKMQTWRCDLIWIYDVGTFSKCCLPNLPNKFSRWKFGCSHPQILVLSWFSRHLFGNSNPPFLVKLQWHSKYSIRSIGPSLNFLIHLVLELNSIYPKLIIANYGVRFIIPFHESKHKNTIISNFNLSNRGSAPGVAGFQSIRSLAGGASEGTSQFCSVEPLWWVMKNGGFHKWRSPQ